MSKEIENYLACLDIDPKLKGLDKVQAMQERHLELFCFSSVNVILEKDLPLENAELFNRIVTSKEGGYCFEHNKIFYEALRFLGFDVTILLGRVLNNHIRPVPQTHRVTLLRFEGKEYVVDVGFGAYTPHLPLALESSVTTQRGHHYRVTKDHDTFYVSEQHGDKDFIYYSFTKTSYFDEDCEMGHFYSHKHPKAAFVNNLVVSKILSEKVYSLRNHEFHEMIDDKRKVRTIETQDDLKEVLQEYFELSLKEFELAKLFTHIS